MKDRDALLNLIDEINKIRGVLGRMNDFFIRFKRRHPDWLTMDIETVMGGAQFFSNFYTCAETIFVRISSFFENNLDTKRWHSHVLERMTMAVEGQRPRVITDETARQLFELLKFRHFTRYYFDFEYDREKLAFLEKKYRAASTSLEADLNAFMRYLDSLKSSNP